MRFDEHFITGTIKDVSILYNTFPKNPSFSIDSRTVKENDIFIALEGSQVDGHMYVSDALAQGAAGCIIAADKKHVLTVISTALLEKKLVIVVPNTLYALVQLASVWRLQFSYPVVAITGSVGKTSTKEMLSSILQLHGKPYIASYGNENTKIGVALNVLRMRPFHEIALFELGVSRRGEMVELVNIVRPTTAIITNIGHQHMDGLGSLHDIALEKREVFKCFTENSIGIINGDQPLLAQVSYVHPVIKCGAKTTNQIQARKIKITDSQVTFSLRIYKRKHQIKLPQPHMGAVFNSLTATAAAQLLGIPDDTIIQAIQSSGVVGSRFERRLLKNGNGMLINDCYNANPESMKASLLAFQNIHTSAYKIAILGDMLGLGINSPFWHRQLGRFLRKVPTLKHIILVGKLVQWTKNTIPVPLSVEKVDTWQEALVLLESRLTQDSLVLVKGSLGVGLSNIVNHLSIELDNGPLNVPFHDRQIYTVVP